VRKIFHPLSPLALACVMIFPAQAQPGEGRAFMTAARLLEMCKTDSPYCTAYVAAVADTLAPLSEPGGPLPAKSLASFCPKQMTIKQAITAFQKFAQNNPEGLAINAAQFVGDALHVAYPCPSN
jgi:Rap1a immunity proteins